MIAIGYDGVSFFIGPPRSTASSLRLPSACYDEQQDELFTTGSVCFIDC